jgi:hypothetical protein
MKSPDPPASRVPGRQTPGKSPEPSASPVSGRRAPETELRVASQGAAGESSGTTGDWRLATGVSVVGEVIEADTLRFRAECPRLYGAPPFGSFVRVEGASSAVFGVVSHITTTTVDAGRQTQALHLPPERLAERMPQLSLLLRTCFTAVTVGYRESTPPSSTPNSQNPTSGICPYLPPLPPEIHRFVYPCTPAEVEALTREPDFLRILASADAPVEDVLSAAILSASAARGSAGALTDAFLVDCGKAVATLFRREPDRFQSVMRRLQSARHGAGGVGWERPLELD